MLKDAIQMYMHQIDDTAHEDLVRAFFRLHVGDLGKLLRAVADVVRSQANLTSATSNVLLEANRVVIVSSSFSKGLVVAHTLPDCSLFCVRLSGVQSRCLWPQTTHDSCMDEPALPHRRCSHLV